MNGFLLHLQGPMMSFGDIGFGQLRDAGNAPSRSAVIGVIAAALGIERGDAELLRLHRDLCVHVGMARAGTIAVDYHTVATAGYGVFDASQLRRGGVRGANALLTYRTYHMDSHFVVLVTSDDVELAVQCRAALRRPVFTGYLGRRSCPPSTPLLPVDVKEDSITKALADGVVSALEKRLRAQRPWDVIWPGHFDAFLDRDYRSADRDRLDVLATGYRRDLLIALPRSYVNRPVVHARIALPPRPDRSVNTTEEYFHAAP